MATKARLAVVSGSALALVLAVDCGGSILIGDQVGEPLGDAGETGRLVMSDEGTEAPTDSVTVSFEGGDARGSADAGSVVTVSFEGGDAGGSADAGSMDSGNCITVEFDPRNCGACGHDCMGGACQNGTCVPLPAGVLASGQITPSSIAVDANNVYWVNDGYTQTAGLIAPNVGITSVGFRIMKCAKTGCNNNPTVLVKGAMYGSPEVYSDLRGLAVDDTNVYWNNNSFPIPGIAACAIQGCNNGPRNLSSQFIYPFGAIAANAGQVYGVGQRNDTTGTWQVYGCSVNNCNPTGTTPPNVLFMSPNAGALAPLIGTAVDGIDAYFASDLGDGGAILSCALGGCGGVPKLLTAAGVLATDAGLILPWQLAVDQTNVYWDLTRYQPSLAGPAAGQVLACQKGGCAGPTVLASGLRNPTGLTTDGVSVYFAERGDTIATQATEGRVAKCSVTGCSNQPTVIAGNLSYPQGIAVDDSHVYWTDLGSAAQGISATSDAPLGSLDGRIMMAPK